MNRFKKILAILALASIAVFVIAVLALLVVGKLAEYPGWIYGPMSVFLLCGLTAICINYLQKRAEKQRRQEENPQENP